MTTDPWKASASRHPAEPAEIRTALGIRERGQRGKQTSNSAPRHDAAVAEEWVDANRALAHVHESLRDAYHEQAVRLLVIVARELPEHLREPCVVRARTDQTHGEDRVQCDGEVVVVAILGQGVEDRQLGI